jgi:valyl-tRNA synthetase
VLRAHCEHGTVPWRHVAISGWILDPDRKKMSKSRGRAVTPAGLLEEYGSDAVRYWAASGRPGVDTAFDIGQMKIGRRLAIKLLNASRFALGAGASPGEVTQPLDLALLARLGAVVAEATKALDAYDYTRALEITEEFFWAFCDDYLELVKGRAYGEQGPEAAASARAALAEALSTVLRLLAPFLPFVTEEVWSWWRDGSVHRAAWPSLPGGDDGVLVAVTEAITAVRKAKSGARLSMRAEVGELVVTADPATEAALRAALPDLRAAGHIASVTFVEGTDPTYVVRC